MNVLQKFLAEDSGATAIEYGLIAALIAVGIIAAATALGGSLSGLFNAISNKFNNAAVPWSASPKRDRCRYPARASYRLLARARRHGRGRRRRSSAVWGGRGSGHPSLSRTNDAGHR